ncbi:hypothetical protein BH09SUM1_BH09SUM1_02590 [soil metagenome]
MMKHRIGGLLFALFALTASAAPNLIVDSAPDPGAEIEALPREWSVELGDPVAAAEFFAVYNLRIIAAANSPDGPRLFVMNISEGKLAPSAKPISAEGLPADFKITAMTDVIAAQKLILAGAINGKPRVFRSALDPKGETSPWEALPDFTENFDEQITQLCAVEKYVVAFTDRTRNGEKSIGGWAANTVPDAQKLTWIAMPTPLKYRFGGSVIALRERLYLVGGTTDAEKKNSVSYTDMISLNGPEFTAWERAMPPIDRRVLTTRSLGYGAAAIVLPSELSTADAAVSQTLLLGADLGGRVIAPWREFDLQDRKTLLRGLAVDAGNSTLLTFSDGNAPDTMRISAYKVPGNLMAKRSTPEEDDAAKLEKYVAKPVRRTVPEALERAKREGTFALLVIVGVDGKEDIAVRSNMAQNQYRYLTQGLVTSYLSGKDGDEASKKYGVKKTPAYLLIDADGKLTAHHEGSVPSGEQLFKLVAPARDAPANPTATATAAP